MARKKKKRSDLMVRVVTAAAAAVAVIAVLLVILNSQVTVIKNISVVGNRTILAEEIIALSGVSVGDRYKARSDAQIAENLSRNRYLNFERCTFDFNSRRLTLHVSERIGWGVVGAYGLYYVVDQTGVVLECTGDQYPDNVAGPKIIGLIETEHTNMRPTVGARLPIQTTSRLEAMEQVLTALDQANMLMRIAMLDVTLPDDISLLTDAGTSIALGGTDSLMTKLLIAQEVIYRRESLGDLAGAKIDVSSGERAHFIPSVRPTPTSVPTATPVPTNTPSPHP